MLRNGSKKRNGITAVAILIVISFFFLTANIKFERPSTFIESIIVTIISPLQELTARTFNKINQVWKSYIFLINVQKENYTLKRDIGRLNFENNALIERLNKFQRLEKLSEFVNKTTDLNLLPADAVGFDSTGWSKVFIINKGLNDGVKKDMAVITYNGLVGKIVQSTSGYSKVILITDQRSAVDAMIQRTRDRGIVAGINNKVCEMKYLSINSDVKEGDMVISSGLGGIFQKGLPIGTISKVYEKNTGLFRNVEIIPSADLARMEELLVIISPFEIPEVK